MSTEDRINKLEIKIENLENKIHEQDMTLFRNREELKDIIREAVSEANEKLIKKIENHEQRIQKLENLDGEKAKIIIKSIGATTLGWIILGILNNLNTVFFS